MAKPKTKRKKKQTASQKVTQTLAALLTPRALKFGAAGVFGIALIAVAAVAGSAWTPNAKPKSGDAVVHAIPARVSPPVAPIISRPPTPPEARPQPETAPYMESSVDPAPQPAARPDAPPPAKVAPPPAPTGTPPWLRNARPVPAESGPRIAIVIDDAGLDRARTARMIALPAPLTISFLTYGDGLLPQVRAAAAAGHEMLVHVAMEATSRSIDPGPDVLLRDIEPDEVLSRLTRVLGRFDGYVGINNHMGSLFTADRASMQIVLSELKRRGLLFFDSRTGPSTVGGAVSRELQLPFAERDVFLDNEPTVSAVNKQLAELERIARARGAASAIGHPHDGTIDALTAWIPIAKERGFVLAPISAIVKDNFARGGLSAQR